MASESAEQGNRHNGVEALISQGNPYGGVDQIAADEGRDWWKDAEKPDNGLSIDEQDEADEAADSENSK